MAGYPMTGYLSWDFPALSHKIVRGKLGAETGHRWQNGLGLQKTAVWSCSKIDGSCQRILRNP